MTPSLAPSGGSATTTADVEVAVVGRLVDPEAEGVMISPMAVPEPTSPSLSSGGGLGWAKVKGNSTETSLKGRRNSDKQL